MTYFTARSNLVTGFPIEKSENSGFSETIAASDLKGRRSRHLSLRRYVKVKVISLPYIFQVLYVLCFTGPKYQVSVYRTIGPLVYSVTYKPLYMQIILGSIKVVEWPPLGESCSLC